MSNGWKIGQIGVILVLCASNLYSLYCLRAAVRTGESVLAAAEKVDAENERLAENNRQLNKVVDHQRDVITLLARDLIRAKGKE